MNNKIIPFQRPIKLFKHLTLALLLLPASTFAQQYQLIDLGLDVSPKDINNLGTIVGSRNTGTYTTTAFRYTSSAGIKNLPEGTIANAINNNDQIIGNTATGAFLYDGKLIYIGDDYTGQGINEYGQLSGQTHTGQALDQLIQPFMTRLLDNGVFMMSPRFILEEQSRVFTPIYIHLPILMTVVS